MTTSDVWFNLWRSVFWFVLNSLINFVPTDGKQLKKGFYSQRPNYVRLNKKYNSHLELYLDNNALKLIFGPIDSDFSTNTSCSFLLFFF